MIPETEPVKVHYGNNTAKEFDFDFLIESESQLKVTHIDFDGITTILQYGIDYTINEIGNKNGSHIIFPIQGSKYNILGWNESTDKKETLVIELSLPFAQEAEYEMSKDLNKKNLENSFDYQMRCLQILNRKISRSIQVPEGSNNSPEELIENIKQAQITVQSFARAAEEQAKTASKYAINAEEQATISQQQATEAKNSATTAEETLKNIQEEAEKQREKIKALGFYQKDGKFFYINEEGEETPLKFEKTDNLFDLVQKDHILTFEEKEGLELLGEYVYKEATDGRYGYPDFYNKCLEEYKPYYENQQFYKNIVFTGNINSDNEDIKGFTLYSYIELKQIKEEINSFKIECDFILPDSLEKDTAVYGSKNDNGNTPKLLVKTNGKLIFEIPSESETKSFEEDYVLGSSYHSELSWEGTKANLVLQNETKKEQQISVSSLTWDDFLCFGRNYEAIFTNGSIKKESIKVYINGNLYAGAFTEKVNTKAKKLERVFEQPTLIENGEIGGINFAVQANKEYSSTSNAAFMAFNQDYKHYNNQFFAFSGNNGEYIIYNPNPLCINKLTIMNDSSQFILTYRLEVSDDGIVWWPLTEILTNDTLTADEFWDINLSSNKYHKYYKLIVISGIGNTAIREIIIKALEQYGPEITINPNGHMYYDIKDKEQIDKIYKHDGYAWYYGIDEENQRIFLPRNDFLYYTGNISSKCFMPNDKSKRQFIRINQDYTPKEDGFLYIYNFSLDGSSYEINGKEYAYQSGNGPSHYSGASQFRPVNKGETIKIKQADRAYFVPINGIKLNYTKQIYMVVGNTSVTKGKSEILQVTTSENDTLPLFTGMYYDFKPNHASWIKAGVTASGKVYESAYNELVKILKKEETKYGDDFKIVKEQEKDPDKDYSEYWIVNEDTQTFRTPLKISYLPINADTAPVMGNGMTLGFTNGAEEFSCYGALNGQNYGCLQFGDSQYLNTPAGQVVPETHFNNTNKITGLSTNSKYSGIIADLSGAKSKTAQLYFKVANAVENLELLNAGKVLECVNNCVTKNENKAYIIETYQNDLSGYNIYSNGYCEQWGVTSNNSGTITFLKKYKKKPNVITSPQIYTGAGNQVQDTQYDITLNGFSYLVSQGVVSWRAYGYLE